MASLLVNARAACRPHVWVRRSRNYYNYIGCKRAFSIATKFSICRRFVLLGSPVAFLLAHNLKRTAGERKLSSYIAAEQATRLQWIQSDSMQFKKYTDLQTAQQLMIWFVGNERIRSGAVRPQLHDCFAHKRELGNVEHDLVLNREMLGGDLCEHHKELKIIGGRA